MVKKVVLASSNKGKIKEFTDIFSKKNVEVIPQSHFNVPDAEETGLSFIENAILKARNCSKYTQMPAIADDSGLEVFSLDGEPGIYSARYAGKHGNDEANIIKLLDNLKNCDDRRARFICALAHVKHHKDSTPTIALGILTGEISNTKCGNQGFGYDPVFFIPNLNKTLGEVPEEQKNNISHRAEALRKMLRLLTNSNA